MDSAKNIDSTSVSNSNIPLIKSTPTTTDENDAESIFTLVNQLDFSIEENSKEEFFGELEKILEDEYEKGDVESHTDLINFLIKHTSLDGKISA